MQYSQCKCGEHQHWNSGMPIHDCMGCRKCGTTLSRTPQGHKEVQLHKPKKQFDRNTGELSHYRCSDCMERCDKDGNEIVRKAK